MFDAGEPRGRRNYWKSEYLDALDDQVAGILLDATAALPSPHANVKIFQLGGAVTREPAGPTSAGHRDARYIAVIATAWEDPADDSDNIGWVRSAWRQVNDLSRRGGYVNFLTSDADDHECSATFGGVDLDRLEAIRRRFDPAELFAPGTAAPATV